LKGPSNHLIQHLQFTEEDKAGQSNKASASLVAREGKAFLNVISLGRHRGKSRCPYYKLWLLVASLPEL